MSILNITSTTQQTIPLDHPLLPGNILVHLDNVVKDYPTPDGTCIRDYIHIKDLAHAHYCALLYSEKQQDYLSFNLGTGTGYSVLEIMQSIQNITNKKLIPLYKERRPGDPAILIANSERANKILNWKPHYSDLTSLITSAHLFESNKR